MVKTLSSRVSLKARLFGSMLGLVALATSATAEGGNVQPAEAHPKGYSLAEAAKATAVANTGGPAPDLKFVMVNGDVTVKPGTTLYVPVFFADDTPPVDPAPFPTDLDDEDVVADYLVDAANVFAHAHGLPPGLEITGFFVEVDGKVTVLDDDYTVGVRTKPLADAQPGGVAGRHYIVSAAFLTPLKPGEHTIDIGGIINGAPVVFVSNAVTVK